MNPLEMYNLFIQKLINFIEVNQKYIPFPKVLIWYLKVPWYLKLIVTLIIGYVIDRVVYTAGFIVLQSRSKNEALSFISAFQNPIDFPDSLVYKYSFLFFSILGVISLPFLTLLFFIILFRRISEKTSDPLTKGFKALFLIVALIIIAGVGFLILQIVGLIPYIMFYSSKDVSPVELVLRALFNQGSLNHETTVLSYEYLNKQVTYSLVFEVWGLIILGAMWFAANRLGSQKKHSLIYIFLSGLGLLVIIIGIIVMVTHTFYVTGYFGKSLANYDLDYVRVEYKVNGAQSIQGIRISEDKNRIILRDGCNVTHSITSEEIHITSVTEVGECMKES
ncbi:hypothetical protein [Saccharibacillus deserti]|uniref:hypothetical protein n=1 Tax=Saccharibacillus deserti TaxID=1634444 RepID=UPI0015578E5E|nr:hypothetical protein [Saccharibacillus deserti]